MCYANFTQHSGCGHLGPSTTAPLTLCDAALSRLHALRGPNSPPLTPASPAPFAPPKRSASKRRFLSLSQTLSRSASRGSASSSGGPARAASVRSTAASFSPSTTVPVDIDYAALPAHQVGAVRCGEGDTVRRSKVAGEMDVCEGCRGAMGEMRRMLERYDKTHSIRGTTAFDRFLRHPPSSTTSPLSTTSPGDLTIPLSDSGALQALVLGHAPTADAPAPLQRGGTWDAETLSEYQSDGGAAGPQRAVIVGRGGIEGHPSEAGWVVEGGTNGLGYWKEENASSYWNGRDDTSSLATGRVFAGMHAGM